MDSLAIYYKLHSIHFPLKKKGTLLIFLKYVLAIIIFILQW